MPSLTHPAPRGAPAADVNGPLLAVERLSVRAGEKVLVDDLTFTVDNGECLGVVGESGSGKTMTALATLGLLPDGLDAQGSASLGGTELIGRPGSELRQIRGRRIAMVFQEPLTALNPVLPVGYQVGEMLVIHEGLTRRQARARAIELLSEVRIPDAAARADAYPHELSGGMRQRVVIAMALACQPELLIADEPTTALDVTVQAQILDLIMLLRAERKMSVLFISHNLAVVSQVADRVLVMYGGQAMECAPAGQIFTSPRHPYTHGLLRTVPRLGGARRPLPVLPVAGATVSAPADTTSPACAFAPRCESASEACMTTRPPFASSGDRRSGDGLPGDDLPGDLHRFACWHPVDGSLENDARSAPTSDTGLN